MIVRFLREGKGEMMARGESELLRLACDLGLTAHFLVRFLRSQERVRGRIYVRKIVTHLQTLFLRSSKGPAELPEEFLASKGRARLGCESNKRRETSSILVTTLLFTPALALLLVLHSLLDELARRVEQVRHLLALVVVRVNFAVRMDKPGKEVVRLNDVRVVKGYEEGLEVVGGEGVGEDVLLLRLGRRREERGRERVDDQLATYRMRSRWEREIAKDSPEDTAAPRSSPAESPRTSRPTAPTYQTA
jgi:hypothetical protein